jgi:hypothetical protein
MKNGLLNGNSDGSLGMSLVPMPGNPRYMYFFSNYHKRNDYRTDLKYAFIDLNGDAGAGEVLFKDSFIGEDRPISILASMPMAKMCGFYTVPNPIL